MADDPFDPLAGFSETPKKEKQSKTTNFGYSNPLGDVSQLDVKKAVKSSKVAGRHIRVTLLLLPELESEIEKIASENGLGKNETARWLLSLGLKSYYVDGVRPEIERVTASKVTLPQWKSE